MIAGDKVGEVYLRGSRTRCDAYWHPTDGTPVLLCSIDLKAYNSHPHIRNLFIELATEVAINRGRTLDSAVALRVREPLPREVRF
jgi:hypothetical protein